jgi:hypothetical protein
MTKLKYGIIGSFLLVAMAEITLRLLGVTDFPLYEANNKIGYIPKVSQSGDFLNKNDWAFNSLHMGVSKEFKKSDEHTSLLIGDSIVLGGNPIPQKDKLGPQLQNLTNKPVWPISAGSWSIRNELEYIKQHKEVINSVNQIIFILNSGDFRNSASSWKNPLTHPLNKPYLMSWYILNKLLFQLTFVPEKQIQINTVPDGDWKKEFSSFISEYKNKEIYIFLYPDKSEMIEKNFSALTQYKEELLLLQKESKFKNLKIYNIFDDYRWNQSTYRDDIHPNIAGYKVLAQILAKPETEIFTEYHY